MDQFILLILLPAALLYYSFRWIAQKGTSRKCIFALQAVCLAWIVIILHHYFPVSFSSRVLLVALFLLLLTGSLLAILGLVNLSDPESPLFYGRWQAYLTLGIAIYLVSFGGSDWVIAQRQSTLQEAKTGDPALKHTRASEADQIANARLETFHSKYGYTLHYPPEWTQWSEVSAFYPDAEIGISSGNTRFFVIPNVILEEDQQMKPEAARWSIVSRLGITEEARTITKDVIHPYQINYRPLWEEDHGRQSFGFVRCKSIHETGELDATGSTVLTGTCASPQFWIVEPVVRDRFAYLFGGYTELPNSTVELPIKRDDRIMHYYHELTSLDQPMPEDPHHYRGPLNQQIFRIIDAIEWHDDPFTANDLTSQEKLRHALFLTGVAKFEGSTERAMEASRWDPSLALPVKTLARMEISNDPGAEVEPRYDFQPANAAPKSYDDAASRWREHKVTIVEDDETRDLDIFFSWMADHE